MFLHICIYMFFSRDIYRERFIANLFFVCYYENKLLLDTKKRDLRKARFFSNTFRFIDDLCAINDHLKFNRNFTICIIQSYNSKRKTFQLSNHHFYTFLLKWKNIKTHLYNKRDAFPFSIGRMSQLDSKIPSNIYYVSIGSEIFKFSRTTSDINTFVTPFNRLLKRMPK